MIICPKCQRECQKLGECDNIHYLCKQEDHTYITYFDMMDGVIEILDETDQKIL